jgi:FkbM family methyltransferase
MNEFSYNCSYDSKIIIIDGMVMLTWIKKNIRSLQSVYLKRRHFVTLASGAKLHVNSDDNRGLAILRTNGQVQANISKLWIRINKLFKPELVIDVGLNYGEILFCANYEPSSQVIGIEANPALIKYLEKSLSTHSNKTEIIIINSLASDVDTESSFYIDNNWSGKSSGIQRNNDIPSIKMKSVILDNVVDGLQLKSHSRLLFKIDVEGFEAKVIAGMSKTLQRYKEVIGVIEFDEKLISMSGTSPAMFFSELKKYFLLFIVSNSKQTHLTPVQSFDELLILSKGHKLHLDLLLISPNLEPMVRNL